MHEIDNKTNIVLLYNDNVMDILVNRFSSNNDELLLNYEISEQPNSGKVFFDNNCGNIFKTLNESQYDVITILHWCSRFADLTTRCNLHKRWYIKIIRDFVV